MADSIERIIDALDTVRARLNMKMAEENPGQSVSQEEDWHEAYDDIVNALNLLMGEDAEWDLDFNEHDEFIDEMEV